MGVFPGPSCREGFLQATGTPFVSAWWTMATAFGEIEEWIDNIS